MHGKRAVVLTEERCLSSSSFSSWSVRSFLLLIKYKGDKLIRSSSPFFLSSLLYLLQMKSPGHLLSSPFVFYCADVFEQTIHAVRAIDTYLVDGYTSLEQRNEALNKSSLFKFFFLLMAVREDRYRINGHHKASLINWVHKMEYLEG